MQKNKKWLSPRRDAPFRVYFYIIQTTKQKKFSPRRDAHSKLKKGSRLGEMHLFEFTSMQHKHLLDLQRKSCIWNEFEHYFEHLTHVMNKPMSCLFVFSVVYCVVFKQKLKWTKRKHKTNRKKQKSFEKNRTTEIQDFQPRSDRE